jgi:hypothetical protein
MPAMSAPQQDVRRKRYGLYASAILLLLIGGAALFVGMKNFGVRCLGLVACIASVYLIRISNVRARPSLPMTSGDSKDFKAGKKGTRLMWIIGAALVPVAGASFFYLYRDGLRGYHDTLPVYIFAGVAALCTVVWSYLVSRLLH